MFSCLNLSSLRFGANTNPAMLTLYSYPTLFGVADNNGYGLKVYAFLKLAGVPFTHTATTLRFATRSNANIPT